MSHARAIEFLNGGLVLKVGLGWNLRRQQFARATWHRRNLQTELNGLVGFAGYNPREIVAGDSQRKP